MPGQLFNNNCQYTAISTIGTTTVDQGPPPTDPGIAGRWGVFYGFAVTGTGTAGMGVTAYDLQVVVTGTGTITNSTALMVGTATAPGQVLQAGVAGVGIRYKGSLVVVTSGTAGAGLSLWD
jgi:archaellum component FlaG (FlaF/FlaG flagellin family)